MKKVGTHFTFDGKKVFASHDLISVFQFLMEIEKELESFLDFEKKLDFIRDGYKEMLDCARYLGQKLVENEIDFEFVFSKKPENVIDKFDLHLPLRSQIIVLFSNIEVLFCLNIAYQYKLNNEAEIISFTMNKKIVKKFLNKYYLSHRNEYYETNKGRFSKVSAVQLRNLRNCLTRFFSTGLKIGITPKALNEKSRKLEKLFKENGHGDLVFISPEDLFEMTKNAVKLMLEEWNEDYLKNQKEFEEKISAVKNIIKEKGAVIVQNGQLNL